MTKLFVVENRICHFITGIVAKMPMSDDKLPHRPNVQPEYYDSEKEYARLETHIANESALWPAQGQILPNVDAATIYAFLKAVIASIYISSTLLFLLIGWSSASDKTLLSILLWPLFSIFMSLIWGTFLALPITILSGAIFLPFYSFAINRIPANHITFMLTGALIAFPAGWLLNWHVAWTGFYVVAGAIGGALFYWFDQVQPKRNLFPTQTAH